MKINFGKTVTFFSWSKKFHEKLLEYLLNEQSYHLSSNKHHRHLCNFEDWIILQQLLEDSVQKKEAFFNGKKSYLQS